MPIPVAVAVAIAAAGAYSSYRQARLANAQKREQARVAEMNAATAILEGDLAIKAALGLESDSRRQTEQLIGEQRATMAASGFAVGEGSFADIIEGSVVMGEIDAAVIQYEAELTKFRKEKEARALRAEARALRASQQDPGLAGIGGALPGIGAIF